jgi:sporulation protein YlmC with PRC-barrel domain
MVSENRLTDVQQGMEVYDQAGDKVGTVSRVVFGVGDTLTEERVTPTGIDLSVREEDSIVDNIAEVFAGESNMPEVVRKRLVNDGFIQIDAGLLHSDRYATPDQVANVGDDRVTLNVAGDELISV